MSFGFAALLFAGSPRRLGVQPLHGRRRVRQMLVVSNRTGAALHVHTEFLSGILCV